MAYKISQELPYQILRADPLRDSFAHCLPETHIGIDTAWHNEQYQKFLHDYLCRMTYEARERYGYVLEGFEISFDSILNRFQNEDTLLYCLGTVGIDEEEFATNVKENDTPYDWTYGMQYPDLVKFAHGEIAASERLKTQCEMHQIPFYNTAFDREKTLDSIVSDVKKHYQKVLK